ncbi:secondary thiamine-phosphate synthase enzyme YjbQ [Aliiglaciecola litoralis]|uniref:Secondary thiamine-phosphate synthase enzyme YjbQ n=1 Tax=Aliiglaciecola litoralis TaxID=582857 RepID=A0ABN1LT12_9ALTE
MWIQKNLVLNEYPRGFHLITTEIIKQLPEIRYFSVGILHLFIKHTSASLTINENADPTVRKDMETHINKMVPEGMEYYLHNYEGEDDMPAHIKASIFGNSTTVPITDGKLTLGTWQGIYLGEHRDAGGDRKLVATLNGKEY